MLKIQFARLMVQLLFTIRLTCYIFNQIKITKMQNTTTTETYKIVLLTPQGLKTEIYTTETPLEVFTDAMVKKYGTFTTYTSNLITN